jgi:signal transduction histidine kinase
MLVNIVENAIRHTPPGTRIELALRKEQAAIVGSVTDNGPGVLADERERIFNRFYRPPSSTAVPGSGLGLSLVKAVADIHDARVEARDAEPGLAVVIHFRAERTAKTYRSGHASDDKT